MAHALIMGKTLNEDHKIKFDACADSYYGCFQLNFDAGCSYSGFIAWIKIIREEGMEFIVLNLAFGCIKFFSKKYLHVTSENY